MVDGATTEVMGMREEVVGNRAGKGVVRTEGGGGEKG